MIRSVRQDGTITCMTIEGAMNAEVFRIDVRDFLLPALSASDILVMDNSIELMWSKVKSLLLKAEGETTRPSYSPSATHSHA